MCTGIKIVHIRTKIFLDYFLMYGICIYVPLYELMRIRAIYVSVAQKIEHVTYR